METKLKEARRLFLWSLADSRKYLDTIISARENHTSGSGFELTVNDRLQEREHLDTMILQQIVELTNGIEPHAVVLFQVLGLPDTEILSEEQIHQFFLTDNQLQG